MTQSLRNGKLVRIFVDERDHTGMQPTYPAVVEFLRSAGIAGATVFRGIEGFGGHREVHLAKVFSWVPNLPIVIEIVDDWSRIEPILDDLKALVPEGLLSIENVQYERLGA